jgi:hypothetical protein
MGRLRRKIDGSDETRMIRNVRGEGFVLSATHAPSKNSLGLQRAEIKQRKLTSTNSNNV